jgi:hypothetical protein
MGFFNDVCCVVKGRYRIMYHAKAIHQNDSTHGYHDNQDKQEVEGENTASRIARLTNRKSSIVVKASHAPRLGIKTDRCDG